MALEQEDSMSVPERNEGVADLIKRMELGLVNDEEIRRLMRIQIENRLKWGYKPTHDQQLAQHLHFINSLKEMKMATEMDSLDSQVYETPSTFQQIMCGRSMKESAGLFMDDVTTLEEAHMKMMDLYCDKATFQDGQKVLDLGCGHGSVVLHVAQKYKGCQVTGVTNSSAQKQYIVEQCKKLDLSNVEIILADVTTLEMEEKFDRVIIIGLIEHMKNFKLFFQKVSKWMKEGGLLFLENYFHKDFAYHCEKIDEDDWYDGYIFPPGSLLMPSASTLLYFQEDLTVADHWVLPGTHFAKTFEEFLKKIDLRIEEVREIFEAFYGISKEEAMKLSNYWRIFCISAMEIFNYNNGQEWMISHLLYTKK